MVKELFENVETIDVQSNDQVHLNTQVIEQENLLELELTNKMTGCNQYVFLTPNEVDSLIEKLTQIRRNWPSEVKQCLKT